MRARIPAQADVAQLVEHFTRNEGVRGSNPRVGSRKRVSREALRDAATICSLFNMITRLADALGWDVPAWEQTLERAPAMLEGGYSLRG